MKMRDIIPGRMYRTYASVYGPVSALSDLRICIASVHAGNSVKIAWFILGKPIHRGAGLREFNYDCYEEWDDLEEVKQ